VQRKNAFKQEKVERMYLLPRIVSTMGLVVSLL